METNNITTKQEISLKDIYLRILALQAENQTILLNQAILNTKIEKIAKKNDIDVNVNIEELKNSIFVKTSNAIEENALDFLNKEMNKKFNV